jgi:type II secretory pathway component PulF
MSFLARHYEYRFSRMRELLRSAVIPAMVCVMGTAVLFIVLAVFQPLIALINAQSYGSGGF